MGPGAGGSSQFLEPRPSMAPAATSGQQWRGKGKGQEEQMAFEQNVASIEICKQLTYFTTTTRPRTEPRTQDRSDSAEVGAHSLPRLQFPPPLLLPPPRHHRFLLLFRAQFLRFESPLLLLLLLSTLGCTTSSSSSSSSTSPPPPTAAKNLRRIVVVVVGIMADGMDRFMPT